MGQYCSNPLQYLIDEHGEDVGKMIVIEKSKQYLNQKFPEIKTELAGQTQKMETKIMGEVDTETKSALDNILSKVKEVKESKKHQIQMFEKVSNKKVDDMLGVNELTHKVDDLKSKSSVKVKEMSTNILKEADTIAVKQNELLDSQKPKIPAYDNLPQCLKDKVWEEGNKKFGEQIEAEKKKQESFIKDSLNLENLKKKFGGELPTDEVKKISSEFDEKFNTVKSSIDAGSIGGKISGFLHI